MPLLARLFGTFAVVSSLLVVVGCGTTLQEPEPEPAARRSLVCAPSGQAVAAADTVSLREDGSCPVGFDVMVWT